MGIKTTIAKHLGVDILDLGVGTGALMGVGAGVAALGTGVAAIGAIPVVAGVALGAACAAPAIIFAKATSHLVDFAHKKLDDDLQHGALARTLKIFGCGAGIALGAGVAAGIACIPALGLTVVSAATVIGAVAVAAAIAMVARFVFGKVAHFAVDNIRKVVLAHNIAYVNDRVDGMDWGQAGDFTSEQIQELFLDLHLTDDEATELRDIRNRIKNHRSPNKSNWFKGEIAIFLNRRLARI